MRVSGSNLTNDSSAGREGADGIRGGHRELCKAPLRREVLWHNAAGERASSEEKATESPQRVGEKLVRIALTPRTHTHTHTRAPRALVLLGKIEDVDGALVAGHADHC
jgi:hypothetical protein